LMATLDAAEASMIRAHEHPVGSIEEPRLLILFLNMSLTARISHRKLRIFLTIYNPYKFRIDDPYPIILLCNQYIFPSNVSVNDIEGMNRLAVCGLCV